MDPDDDLDVVRKPPRPGLPQGSELLHRCRSREHRELRRYHVSMEMDLFILGPPEFILGLPYAR